MSPASAAVPTKVASGSHYQLDKEQVLKASAALLKHIKSSSAAETGKKSLLADADGEETDDSNAEAIWLTLTTKKHITDTKRLKPARIAVPHPLNTSANTTICLITADPQRTYKDLVQSPAFPKELAARITKVVGVDKIKRKWSQYEQQRKLFAEHDIFLADDRIIIHLPKILGQTFYKSTAKRPIPVNIAEKVKKVDGKKEKEGKTGAGAPKDVAKEVENAIQGALVHLSPGTNTAIRVGYSSWDAEKIAANVEAVTEELIERFVPQKWKNVRSLHIKGPNTAALPIWLTDALWVKEDDVLGEVGAKKVAEANISKKRKSRALTDVEVADEDKKEKKKQKLLPESSDANLDEEIKARKEKLKKQKAEAAEAVEDDVPEAAKKAPKKAGGKRKRTAA